MVDAADRGQEVNTRANTAADLRKGQNGSLLMAGVSAAQLLFYGFSKPVTADNIWENKLTESVLLRPEFFKILKRKPTSHQHELKVWKLKNKDHKNFFFNKDWSIGSETSWDWNNQTVQHGGGRIMLWDVSLPLVLDCFQCAGWVVRRWLLLLGKIVKVISQSGVCDLKT